MKDPHTQKVEAQIEEAEATLKALAADLQDDHAEKLKQEGNKKIAEAKQKLADMRETGEEIGDVFQKHFSHLVDDIRTIFS